MLKHENKSAPRKLTYQKVFNLVLEFFGYDKDKAIKWWMNKNIHLGNVSPFEMVKSGRGRKLMNFIETSIAENYRE